MTSQEISLALGLKYDTAMCYLASLEDVRFVRRIGDCFGPGIIASAIYQGHRYARELDKPVDLDGVPFRRERHIIEVATDMKQRT